MAIRRTSKGSSFVHDADRDAEILIASDAALPGLGTPRPDTMSGGALNDTISGLGGPDSLQGWGGDDVLVGGTGDDTALGGDGDDTLDGTAGKDLLLGGIGNDVLRGGTDDDSLVGGSGDDRLDGSVGNDSLLGGDGADFVFGATGDDTIAGATGNDSLNGGTGNDLISGGDGTDLIWGAAGDDTLGGGTGSDSLDGGLGNDSLVGGSGANLLRGGIGNDTLIGGGGNDLLVGDLGADQAIYAGIRADYDIVTRADGSTMVVGRRGVGLSDGTDILRGVELVRFADQVVSLTGNRPPTDMTLLASTASENVPGEIVGRLVVTDPDPRETYTYSVSDGRFLVTATGVLRLKPGITLDHEVEPQVTLRVTATDSGALAVTRQFVVTVGDANDAPTVAAPLAAIATEDGAPLRISLLAGASDQDAGNGDALTVAGLPASLPAGWTMDANGRDLVVDTSGNAFQQLAEGQTASETISFSIRDGSGASVPQSLTVTITGANDAPLAADVASATTASAAVVGRLDAEDVDSDDDPDSLTYVIVAGPPAGKGQLTLGEGGAFRFDPGDDFADLGVGQEEIVSIRYRVVDRHGEASSEQVLAITVRGDEDASPAAPVLSGISTDTGTPDDEITSDRTLVLNGTATAGAEVDVYLGGTLIGSATASARGDWSFDYARVTLADGQYEFTAVARIGDQTSAPSSPLDVTVDGTGPTGVTTRLSSTSDTGVAGDGETSLARVTLVGTAEAGATVEIAGTGVKALVSGDGSFVLPDVALADGGNALTIRVVDAAGNATSTTMNVVRTAAGAQADPVIAWNHIALETIRSDASIPTYATRALALESIAVLDTLAAMDGTPAFMVGLSAPDGIPAAAAVAAAAHRVLTHLYPSQQAALDGKLAATLATLPDDAARADAVAFGRAVADAVIALRDVDGWDAFVTYEGGTGLGEWRPTGPAYGLAQSPQWAFLTPFTLESGDQFRADAPPELTSAEYAASVEEVRRLGSATSTERTAEQTEIARFWADGSGTYTPPGHWNGIATEIAGTIGYSYAASARLLAVLNVGLADASIASWDTKYTHVLWRPITAIREAGSDGNAATLADPSWSPLLITPPHPEYVSGHSTYSAAAASILTDFFGARSFTTTSIGLPGVTRSFDSFEDAAAEAGRSRIYGGIHYEFSNQAGQALGRDVASWVLDSFRTDADARAPVVLLDQESREVLTGAPELTGFALDNLAGLSSLDVRLDGGAFRAVGVDERGRFTLDVGDVFGAIADGQHSLEFRATDAAGNVGTGSPFTFTVDRAAPVLTVSSLADGDTLEAGARLTGLADGTGSSLIALSYSWDGGEARPIIFDAATGAFDAALDLKRLGPGDHTLTLTAKDAAGFVETTTLSVKMAAAVPFAVERVTPTDGAGDVGVTFRPQVTFTRAVDAASLTAETFFATDAGGNKIAANIVLSQDATKAWLFFDEALPGGTRISLHLDGDAIRARGDGAALDANGDGAAGGDLLTGFETVSRQGVTGTSLKGFVVGPGADLKPMTFDDFRAGPDGAGHTADDVFLERLAGVKVYILGMEDKAVYTAADGSFELKDIPTGVVKVAIDGRTATNAPAGVFYPEMVMDVTIRPAQVNTLMGTMGTTEQQLENLTRGEVYLPRIASSVLTDIAEDAPTVVTTPAEGTTGLTTEQRELIQLVVQPGSVVGEDGQPVANAQVGIATVPPELVRDMLPPGLLQHTFDLTIQAPGAAVFTEPLQLTLPNVFNAPPGTKLNLLSFDHTTGRLVIDGTGTVSADGLYVVTDPGSGVTMPGWHGMTPPGSPTKGPGTPTPPDDDPCELTDILSDVALDNAWKILKTAVNCAAELTSFKKLGKIGEIIQTIANLGDKAKEIYDQALELRESLEKGDRGDVIRDAVVLLKKAKDGIATAIEEFTKDAIDILNKPKSLVKCVADAVDLISGICQSVEDKGECYSLGTLAKIKVACATIDSVKLVTDTIDNAIENAENALAKFFVKKFCDQIEYVLNQIDRFDKGADQLSLTIAAEAADEPTIEEILAALDEALTTGATLDGSATEATDNLENYDSALQGSGDTLEDDAVAESIGAIMQLALGNVPDAPYLIIVDGQEIRGKTDGNGQFEAFLPADTEFTVLSYDARYKTYAEYTGKTAPSGQVTTIPPFVYDSTAGLPDADADTLPDLVERIFGTSATNKDTDGDGVSDFAEIQAGQDPLGGFALPTGIIASLSLTGTAQDIAIAAGLTGATSTAALIATGAAGLAIADLSNPLAPRLLATLDLAGTARSVAYDAATRTAVVATGGTLSFVDLTDPAAPVLAREVTIAATQVEVRDAIAYVAAGRDLRAYDLVTGDLLAVTVLPGNITGLAREGGRLYALDASGTLRLFDAAGDTFIARGTLSLSGQVGSGADRKLFVADGVLYVPASNGFQGGYATVDVRDPAAPALLSGPDATNIAGDAIALTGSGKGVIVGRPGGAFGANEVDVLDTSDPANTNGFITRITLPAAPRDVAIADGFAYVVTDAGLQVVNFLSRDVAGVAPTVTLDTAGLDTDPTRDGVQVQEGTVLPLRATVSDDGQVSSMEVLVNGVAVSADPTYPFDLRAALPALVEGGATTATIQVRATDTGGNVGLSQLLTVELTPDITAPKIILSNVSEGGAVGRSFRTFRISFDEPVYVTGDPADAFRLIGPGGAPVEGATVVFRDGGRSVQITVGVLETGGGYRLELDGAALRDGAGNPLGAGVLTTNFTVGDYDEGLFGTAGGDALTAGDGRDLLSGGPQDNPAADAGSDTLRGGAGEDTIRGLAGSDYLYGDAGDDLVQGGAGYDYLYGGVGNDSLDAGADGGNVQGGEGDDTLTGTVSTGDAGGSLTLYGGAGDDLLRSTGTGTNGYAYGYGEAGDDTVQGWSGNDAIYGGVGNDRLSGEGGNDQLGGGGGLDSMDGGGGNDTLRDDDDPGLEEAIRNPGNGHWYRYVSANLSWDGAVTAARSSTLAGLQGYLVTVTSAAEQAFLTATFGQRSYTWIGASDAALEGTWRWATGPEAGTVFYVQGAATQPGYSNWVSGEPSNFGEEDAATFWSTGNTWNSYSSAFSYGYLIEYGGTAGDPAGPVQPPGDTLLGGAGDDTITSTGGNDVVDGGEGTDTAILDFRFVSAPLTLTLSVPGTPVVLPGGGSVVNVERLQITGTAFGDALTGLSADDTLNGGAGDDTLAGGAGYDDLRGGDGNDSLNLGTGGGYAVGEAGDDTLTGAMTDGFTISLDGGLGDDLLTLTGQATGGRGNLYGQDGNDTLRGSLGGDYLSGGGGLDRLEGRGGNDTLRDDDDPFEDAIHNPANGHWYRYVSANIAWGAAVDAAAAERLGGLQGYLATVTSAAEQAFITATFGERGYTWIGASDAALEGTWRWATGPEAGTVFYVKGAATQPGYSNWGSGQPAGGTNENAAHFYFTDNGWNDYGSAYSSGYLVEYGGTVGDPSGPVLPPGDTLLGGAGDDTITSRGDNDSIDGGDGTDTLILDLSGVARGVAFAVPGSGGSTLSGGGSIAGIERFQISGTAFGDDLDLGAAGGSIAGREGNDTLTAAVADNLPATLDGGAGNDRLTLTGSGTSAYAYAYGREGNDTLLGWSGTDYMQGDQGSDNLSGGEGDDRLNGGGEGLDRLEGGGGNDALYDDDVILEDAIYNPSNGHWYRYVQVSLSWDAAAAAASADTLGGLRGYLATITSAAEQAFLSQAFNSNYYYTWIGATDAAEEGTWRWATGPEAGTAFHVQGAATQPGYSNWVSGEPTSLYADEDYALFQYAGTNWINNRGATGNAYGYLVEYGGTAGDPSGPVVPPGDTLLGGAGDDTITSTGTNDAVDGGDGADTAYLDFSRATAGVAFAPTSAATLTAITGGGSVINVETFDITGSAFGDTLAALGGTDTLNGGEGDDTLDLGIGGGYAYGEDGDDVLAATLRNNASVQLRGGDGNDRLSATGSTNSSSYSYLTGDDGADTLTGTDGAAGDQLHGGTGSDSIAGGDGGDYLSGGGGGLDHLDGGAGNDQLRDDDAAFEEAVYNPANGHWYRYGGNANWADAVSGAAAGTLAGLRGYLVTVTSAAEQAFLKTAFADLSYTWLGASDAALEGTWTWTTGPEAGNAFYVKGAANQTGYSDWQSGDPNGGTGENAALLYLTGDGWLDYPGGYGFAYVVEYGGSAGDPAGPVLPPGDTLLGGAGDDTITSTGDNDVVDGGEGTDTAHLDFSRETVGIAFSPSTVGTPVVLAGGGSVVNVEVFNVEGSAFGDALSGFNADDTLNGGAGDDVLAGGAGDDYLRGGEGNDRLNLGVGGGYAQGDVGNDTLVGALTNNVHTILYGGAGDDRLSVTGTTNSISYSQLRGDEGDDILTGADGNAGDYLYGGTGNDSLLGGGGADYLSGDDGVDILNGGAGRDTLYGGGNADIFRFLSIADAGDQIGDYVAADQIEVSAAGFGGGLTAGSDLGAQGRFASNTTGVATSASGVGQFVFDTDDRQLLWDADGAGGEAARLVAEMLSGSLTASDITVIA